MSNEQLTGRDLKVADFVEATKGQKKIRACVEEITSDGVILLQPVGEPPIHVQVDSPDWSYVLIEPGEVLTAEQQKEAESVFGPADEVQLKQFFRKR